MIRAKSPKVLSHRYSNNVLHIHVYIYCIHIYIYI